MRYSVFDPLTARYHAYASPDLPRVTFPSSVTGQPFVAWEEIAILLPTEATPLNETSDRPSGIVAHPRELQRPEPHRDTGLFWLALGFLVRQLLK